jgi:trimethylguanosine synthase
MTEDAWYGVTQESVAKCVPPPLPSSHPLTIPSSIAAYISTHAPPSKRIILDAFCGVGGNTIAFALSNRWSRVYAIEKDFATLECARHNAKIYGVLEKITFFHGDCFQVLGLDESEEGKKNAVNGFSELVREFGVCFASPPWGGTISLSFSCFST